MQRMVYISGALSDVAEVVRKQYLEFYEQIGQLVACVGLVPYIPHRNTDPVRHRDVTPQAVDLIDRTAVTSSMLVIAVADHPSLGVGVEVEMAYHAHKPVVLLCRRDRVEARKISRLIRGNPSVIREIVYADQLEALGRLEECLRWWLRERAESTLPDILR